MGSLSNETLASVSECVTSFSSRLGSKYRASGLESSSMKLAVVTALRFQLSLVAISFSFAYRRRKGREEGGGRKEVGGRDGRREGWEEGGGRNEGGGRGGGREEGREEGGEERGREWEGGEEEAGEEGERGEYYPSDITGEECSGPYIPYEFLHHPFP